MKDRLEQMQKLHREVKSINKEIARRKGTEKIQADVVSGSLPEFPYTLAHFHIEGVSDPRVETLRTKRRILELELNLLEEYLDEVPDAEIRAIMRYRYAMGYTYKQIGDELGYDASVIWKKLNEWWCEHD